jgi:hypothetical protein
LKPPKEVHLKELSEFNGCPVSRAEMPASREEVNGFNDCGRLSERVIRANWKLKKLRGFRKCRVAKPDCSMLLVVPNCLNQYQSPEAVILPTGDHLKDICGFDGCVQLK